MKLTEVDNSFSRNMLSGNLEGRTFNGVTFSDATKIKFSERDVMSYSMDWEVPVTIKYTTMGITGEMWYEQNTHGPVHKFSLQWLAVRMRTSLPGHLVYSYTNAITTSYESIGHEDDDFVTGLTTFLKMNTDLVTKRWDTILADRDRRFNSWFSVEKAFKTK